MHFYDIICLLKMILNLTMTTSVSSLSLEQLQQKNARLLALVGQQETFIENLKHQLFLFRNARFGRKSEKNVVAEQLSLQFDEAVLTEEPSPEVADVENITETITYTRKKKTPGRKALPQSLPFVEKVYDLTDEEKQCACGCTLTSIGEEVSEQLDTLPQITFRVVHIRKKYACKGCEETVQQAKAPEPILKQSIATPGLLAAVINSKFNHHMPLYRQEAMFNAAGISITRGTLSNWLIHSGYLLTPLVKLLTADILDHDVAYADETTLQVLKEKEKSPSQKSYMWLFMGGPPSKRAVVYQYHPNRKHQILFDFFDDYQGYVHADCYEAYVVLGKKPLIHHVACWAHARRYFVNVVKSSKKKGLAHQVVALIDSLYRLERKLKEDNASLPLIFRQRILQAKPILDKIKLSLEENYSKIPPKTPLAEAFFYTLSHWDALYLYLSDARLEIDNNRSERAVKPFVIGRKNWLFHGNDIGAKAGAVLFSLIETCKQNHIDPFSWFKYALTHIKQATTIELLDKLLPYNLDPALLDDMRTLPDLTFPQKSGAN